LQDYAGVNLQLPNGLPRQPEPPGVISELLAGAAVRINGDSPWDIQVYDEKVYRLMLTQGSLGLGRAYMEGLWDSDQLDETFHRLLAANIDTKMVGWARVRLHGEVLRQRLFNLQSPQRAFQVAEQHYDIGNDVFEPMLDSRMIYSCAYWEHASNLEQAQQHKLDMICRKLQLQPGERLLEIGCGWGGLARYAADHYGVVVVGVTVSKAQQKLAQERCAGLPVTIELKDYRDMTGEFDKIVSVGMFEHVGLKNYPIYFDTVRRLLKEEGLFLLHTIGHYVTAHKTDAWIDNYIFPNGKLPSARELAAVLENRFVIEDWHNFGQDYDRTLMAWWDNFERAWPALEGKYGPGFYRMWKYYLMCCAGFFRSRQGLLWQIMLSKRQRRGVYRSMRLPQDQAT
jgi:cyclopropane-fatty-acyl-phospholipid synthase